VGGISLDAVVSGSKQSLQTSRQTNATSRCLVSSNVIALETASLNEQKRACQLMILGRSIPRHIGQNAPVKKTAESVQRINRQQRSSPSLTTTPPSLLLSPMRRMSRDPTVPNPNLIQNLCHSRYPSGRHAPRLPS
jgi:hypothetical protein